MTPHPSTNARPLATAITTIVAVTAIALGVLSTAGGPAGAQAADCSVNLVDDAYTTPQNTALALSFLDVSGNDSVCTIGEVEIVSSPAHGRLQRTSFLGSYAYLPDAGFSGTDSYQYRWDSDDPSNPDPPVTRGTATVTIVVGHTCDYQLRDDSYSTPAATTLVVGAPGVTANDTTCGTTALRQLTAPAHGTLTAFSAGDGGFGYVPDAGFTGTDTFTYDRVVPDVSVPFAAAKGRTTRAAPPGAVVEITVTAAAPGSTTSTTTTTVGSIPPPTVLLPSDPTSTSTPTTTLPAASTTTVGGAPLPPTVEPPVDPPAGPPAATGAVPRPPGATAGPSGTGSPASATLARTGTTVGPLGAVGFSLLVLGGAALVTSRRRRLPR